MEKIREELSQEQTVAQRIKNNHEGSIYEDSSPSEESTDILLQPQRIVHGVTPEPLRLFRMQHETPLQENKEHVANTQSEQRSNVLAFTQTKRATQKTVLPPTSQNNLPTGINVGQPEDEKKYKIQLPFSIDRRAIKARMDAAAAVFDIFQMFDFNIGITADAIAAALPKPTKETTGALSLALGTSDQSDNQWRQDVAGEEKLTRFGVLLKILGAIYRNPPVRIHARGESVTESYANWTISGNASNIQELAA